ncbi:MAG: flagellar motor switch protein FliM [Gammaproteobacteria bacterium]|jgi:flagellar motor switch protein FliM
MASADLLTQDEIDALLHGVDSGDVDTHGSDLIEDGEVQSYDFTSQDRIVRGRLPTLEMINERFARHLRISLFNLLRRSPEVTVGSVQMLKFSEYVHGLLMPASMNLVRIRPLRGTSLFTFDPKLIFSAVDNFFGGNGRFSAKIEGRDFTPTELRVVALILERIFADLTEAWAPVLPVKFDHLGSEINPHFASIVSPSEVVIISVFHIELDGGGGDFHIALPYTMIEPIREMLDTGVQSDRSDHDERWTHSLREEIETADVKLSSRMVEVIITLRELMELRPGDVIPVDFPETVLARVEEVPVFRAKLGTSRGNLALKVVQIIKSAPASLTLADRGGLHE